MRAAHERDTCGGITCPIVIGDQCHRSRRLKAADHDLNGPIALIIPHVRAVWCRQLRPGARGEQSNNDKEDELHRSRTPFGTCETPPPATRSARTASCRQSSVGSAAVVRSSSSGPSFLTLPTAFPIGQTRKTSSATG